MAQITYVWYVITPDGSRGYRTGTLGDAARWRKNGCTVTRVN